MMHMLLPEAVWLKFVSLHSLLKLLGTRYSEKLIRSVIPYEIWNMIRGIQSHPYTKPAISSPEKGRGILPPLPGSAESGKRKNISSVEIYYDEYREVLEDCNETNFSQTASGSSIIFYFHENQTCC
eukprot:sb/3475579/